VERHFCKVGRRFVHYRRQGSGPAVILLHQIPQSSETMESLMELIGPDYTSIAIDAPGFGLSDPLPGEAWSVDTLCDALAQTLDRLGVDRAAFCGQHTGAAMAAQFARRWPDRVAGLALDGYPVFSPQEARTLLPHQMYRFEPSWDGTHLLWAWSRFRDGWMFFPWSVRTRATRRDADMPAASAIHKYQIMELLRSRQSHLAVYPGVFAWDGLAVAQSLVVPTLIAGTAEDQLFSHLERLHGLPEKVRVMRFPNAARAQLLAAQADHVRRCCDGMDGSPRVGPAALVARSAHFDHMPDGRCRSYAAGLAVSAQSLLMPGRPTLVLHGAGSAGEVEMQAALAACAGPQVAIDLPGHGNTGGAVASAAESAVRVIEALQWLGLQDYSIWGRGLGAAVGTEIALALGEMGGQPPARLDLSELRLFRPSERRQWRSLYAAPIEPSWDGAHLLGLWHQIRDRQFFLPWYQRDRAAARPIEPVLDAELLTQQIFAALRCSDWPRAHRYGFDWSVRRLQGVKVPVSFHAVPGDGWARDLDQLRAMVVAGAPDRTRRGRVTRASRRPDASG
jgi:pimeloyl-ACP methyl ester carboxylesterase